MTHFRQILLIAAMLSSLWAGTPLYTQAEISFDDSQPNQLILANQYYQLILHKSNGSILSLLDRQRNVELTLGSRNQCLWGVVLAGDSYIGGCSYATNRIAYRWDAVTSRLSLTYSDSVADAHPLTATLTIQANSEAFFDMQLAFTNHSPDKIINALLPSDLLFRKSAIRYGYLPYILPGIRIEPAYFRQSIGNVGGQTVTTYPSDKAFADYLALDIDDSHLAIYTVNPDPKPVQPVALGFVDNEAQQEDTFFSYHSFHIAVPPAGSWQSPTVRFVVGQPVATTILAYRTANGIDAYPSLSTKLGGKFTTFAQAPLIKHDIVRPFADELTDLARLPAPALLHPVAFQANGHDESYPDFLPPDAKWGTLQDFQAWVQQARQQGILVMPYTNPTWWDNESPTLRNLPAPLQLTDIAALDSQGQPIAESYGSHFGYVMSPSAPFVQTRLQSLMEDWQTQVPVDCIFEDQIGSRVWQRDTNGSEPSEISYSNGWLDHTATYANRCLMTEMGWDRLARNEVGFHGSALTWAREFDALDNAFGAGNWQPYPLALWLFHDKVLLYQHDLSLHTMTEDSSVLTWNLAFGNMLSYNWQWSDNQPLDNAWLRLVTHLQRRIAARYAGVALKEYKEVNANVTQTSFGNLTITANWQPQITYALNNHRIAAGGYYVEDSEQKVEAGSFAGFYNSGYLSAGEHHLLFERTAESVSVYQLLGEDTVLRVKLPANWSADKQVTVSAHDSAGTMLSEVNSWLEAGNVVFVYHQQIAEGTVDHYQITLKSGTAASPTPSAKASIFLPVLQN